MLQAGPGHLAECGTVWACLVGSGASEHTRFLAEPSKAKMVDDRALGFTHAISHPPNSDWHLPLGKPSQHSALMGTLESYFGYQASHIENCWAVWKMELERDRPRAGPQNLQRAVFCKDVTWKGRKASQCGELDFFKKRRTFETRSCVLPKILLMF